MRNQDSEPGDYSRGAVSFALGPVNASIAWSAVTTASLGSFETFERLSTFASRAHSLACCPCGQDHSAELLAFNYSVSTLKALDLAASRQTFDPLGDLYGAEFAALSFPGEVSGTRVGATSISIGDSVDSQIESSGDQDWYAIQLQAGVLYEFSLSGTGADALTDPYLEVMNPFGQQITFNDDGNVGLDSLLRFTPVSTGTYYINAHGWANTSGVTSTGTYTLGTSVVSPQPPSYSIQQIANYLINEGSAGGRHWTQTNITYNIEALTAAQRTLAERALQEWSAVTPLTFTRVTSGGNITFTNVNPSPDPQTPDEPAAYAQGTYQGDAIISSTVVITSNWFSSDTTYDSYTQQTYIHEIGHALGLGHAGPYNGAADWGFDSIYTNDSWAFTVMSYFDQLESGIGNYRFVLGLQQADITAIQQLYGANPSGTHAGNTTFGFNSSAPGSNIDWSQFVVVQAEGIYRRPPSMTIYDTSGVDTINLSGFSQPQIVDLRPGTFSSLGDRPDVNFPHYTNVVSIAANTIIENVVSGAGSDTITGNSANNTITLGSGGDTFVYATGGGADTITDFAVGADRIDLTAFSSAAALTAFNGRTSSVGGTLLTFTLGQTILLQGVSTGQLTQSNLILQTSASTITGTASNDVLNGTSGNDVIDALAGNDTLYGLDGNDTLLGGAGIDNLHGGAGADTLDGGADNDNLYGDALDTFIGGTGYDTIWMTDLTTAGISVNLAAADIERIYATHLADTLDGSGATVGIVLYGFNGADTLIGGSGSDYLYTDYEDIQSGTVLGGAGYDYIIHQSPSSFTGTVTFNMAALQVEGIFGSSRAEIINAAGAPVFATIYTGGGADTVTGSGFNDRIFLDNEVASVNAGAGFDYLVYNRLDGSGASFNLAAMNAEGGIGRDGNDTLDASGVTASFVTLYGYGGADTLRGGTGNDYIYMDAADLSGGAVQGGAGYDYLINQGGTALSITLLSHGAEGFFGSSAAETISAAGLAMFATVFSGGGADTITGSSFNDSIYITNSVAGVNAGAGYDYVVYERLDGTGATNFNLAAMSAEGAIGRGGNDRFDASGVATFATLYGYGGDDTLIGGASNDVIYGGTGNDTIIGNAGNDSFVQETGWGADTITDFGNGADRILFRAAGLTQFSQLTVTQSGADTLVTFGAQTVRLTNFTAANFTAAQTVFVAAAETQPADTALAESQAGTFDFSGLPQTDGAGETSGAGVQRDHTSSFVSALDAGFFASDWADSAYDLHAQLHTDMFEWHLMA
ncbi:MAG: M10 family metallopeptidase C-terminal domain-containing protein [Alphaproteobacteria bacterium]|nr:M10 family metallopeptidase C-terminal domain-containing protein [Alphaproteobacteria bacterium]